MNQTNIDLSTLPAIGSTITTPAGNQAQVEGYGQNEEGVVSVLVKIFHGEALWIRVDRLEQGK